MSAIAERFWSKVNKTDSCWLWTAGQQGWGYGQFSFMGKPIAAHRFSWHLAFGKIPRRLFVCHHCDVRLCVRPDHLFLGTAAENNWDMKIKGRAGRYADIHPERLRKIGRGPERRPLTDRFWSKVEKTDTCWNWTAAKMRDGRGVVSIDHTGQKGSAPRVSWELHFGPIPDGIWVLHRCDNPRCVRPDHLFLGTASDNNKDSVRKGRRRISSTKGEKNPRAKLTVENILYIRNSNIGARVLAKEYGVALGTIYHVRNGYTWGSVP